MKVTVKDLTLTTGATKTQSFGNHSTRTTPVILAEPYRQFRAGTEIGRIQTTRYKSGRQSSASFAHGMAVLHHDRDWLVRQFKEEECGEREARLERIRPGQVYLIRRTFGYLPHAVCCYEPGCVIKVTASNHASVETQVTHPKDKPRIVRWKSDAFRSLVESLALCERT